MHGAMSAGAYGAMDANQVEGAAWIRKYRIQKRRYFDSQAERRPTNLN
jgi:hypothetical protein